MRIHREGHAILIAAFLIFSGIVFAVYYFLPVLSLPLLMLLSLLYLFLLNFFRNPVRNTAINDQHVIAPADGKVVVIEEVQADEYFTDKRLQVSIFMSPLNVHVNRSAIGGTVKYAKYHPGKYLVAWHPKSSTENERNTIVVSNGKVEVLMKQIAGALAKRIKYYVKTGDNIQQGQEFGFIKFGSRVDLLLPLNTKINVQLGQKVMGGETVIATF